MHYILKCKNVSSSTYVMDLQSQHNYSRYMQIWKHKWNKYDHYIYHDKF